VYHRFKERFSAKDLDTNSFNQEDKYLYRAWLKSSNEIVVSTEEQTNVAYVEIALRTLKK
jgi:hypothetical protein